MNTKEFGALYDLHRGCGWLVCDLIKSTTISFVLSTIRARLLTLHQSISRCTSSYTDLSLLLIRSSTVMSSAKKKIDTDYEVSFIYEHFKCLTI